MKNSEDVLSVSSTQLPKPGAALDSGAVAPWTWGGVTHCTSRVKAASGKGDPEAGALLLNVASGTLTNTVDSIY